MNRVLVFVVGAVALFLGNLSSGLLADDGLDILSDSEGADGSHCPIPASIDISDWKLVAVDVPSSYAALKSLARTRPDHMLLLLHLASVDGEAIPMDSRYIKVRSPVTGNDDVSTATALVDDIVDAVEREGEMITRDQILMMAQRAFPVDEYQWQSVCAQAHDAELFDTRLVIASGVEVCNQMALAFPDASSMGDSHAWTEVSMSRIPEQVARVSFPGGIDAEGQQSAPVYAIGDIAHTPR
ncbi:MAG: hypothetical protein GVY32_08225 [Gammaproteobacteria bacterium]|jgi:hypothetical protein|nr:hypothetical protein [Gammaproteobacteria bacterium]